MKKITKATIKSFVKKNFDNLYINVKSSFDGMTDCVEQCDGGFTKVKNDDRDFAFEHTMGIWGAWFVGQSRDYFNEYEADGFKGFEVYNSCGRFILAVKA